jgi:tRNA-splicing ligase RtcB
MKCFHRVPRSNGRDERQEFFWEKVKFLSFWPWDVHRTPWFRAPHLYAIPSQSATARHFIMAINAVANFGFANRMMIAYWAEKAMQQVFRDDELKFRLLYDSSHVTIQAEEHFGKLYWVHRNGANQAMPASRMADHPVYRYTGQPIPIPGSMGTDSYIAVAAEGALQTFCSTNHGAGRLMDKPEARRSFREDQVVYSMEERGIRLYRYGKTPITDQAPEAFKDIDLVVEAMQKYRLATPVARVRPLATLKG